MRQDKRAAPKAPINENISAREVRLIGADGEQIGIVSIDEALRIAEESKLDLGGNLRRCSPTCLSG
jgi:translation initiation factor IF-3